MGVILGGDLISSEQKSVQFEMDFSAKSFNEDTDFEFTI
jgi:hypothetical protein